MGTYIVGFFTLVLFVGVPLLAHAGFIPEAFSLRRFFSEVAFSSSVSQEGTAYNSQNIPLLFALRTPERLLPRGGGDITVVDGALILPSEGPSGTFVDETPKTDQVSIYVVRSGDSLSEIAEMYGVSVNTILWANDIKRGTLIKEGEMLVILPVTGVRHTVVKGETIAGIVKKYKGDLEEVLSYNGLEEGSSLSVGDVLIIPYGEVAPVVTTYSGSSRSIIRGTSGPELVGFFMHPLPIGRKTQGIHGYNGIDIAAPVGTPVRASAAGTVVVSRSGGWNGGYGNYVVVSHANGTQTLYAHHSQNAVSTGAVVEQGEVVGYVGATGRATGSHLHFEIRGAKNPF